MEQFGERFSVEYLISYSHLRWFCFTAFRDWLTKKVAPPFQPIRIETKSNLYLLALVFPRLHLVASSFTWFIVVLDQSEYFGFLLLQLSVENGSQ